MNRSIPHNAKMYHGKTGVVTEFPKLPFTRAPVNGFQKILSNRPFDQRCFQTTRRHPRTELLQDAVEHADSFFDMDVQNPIAGNDPVRHRHTANQAAEACIDPIPIGLGRECHK